MSASLKGSSARGHVRSDSSDDLAAAWLRAQQRLTEDGGLDGLGCSSRGLAERDRSDDWIAVSTGPGGNERYHRGPDAIEALGGLATNLTSSGRD
jgi:hypothetical protein